MPADFDKKEYWHARFSSEQSFEWLLPSAAFMTILEPHLERLECSSRILHLGLGTSDLQNHLRHRGFPEVTNVDYEPIAIERGRQQEEAEFGDVRMRYSVADVTQLKSDLGQGESLAFHLVVDKSTADAVSCAGDSALLSMGQAVKECLVEGGIWISLSYSASRFAIFEERRLFDVRVLAKIPTPKARPTEPDIWHYCYLLVPN